MSELLHIRNALLDAAKDTKALGLDWKWLRNQLTEVMIETRLRKKREPAEPKGEDTQRFEEFWQAWPDGMRKVNQSRCLETWASNKLDAQADEILAHMASMADEWARDGGRFVPMPRTYLNQRRWVGQKSMADAYGVRTAV